MNNHQHSSSASRRWERLLDLATMVAGTFAIIVMGMVSGAMHMPWLGVVSAVAGTAVVLISAWRLCRR